MKPKIICDRTKLARIKNPAPLLFSMPYPTAPRVKAGEAKTFSIKIENRKIID